MALSLDAPVLRFHRLSFVADGDEVVVGRRDIDSYGVFPLDGAALVRELDAGRSLPDAERWYEATYGEKVDMDGLVAVLADLDFLRDATSRWPTVHRWAGNGWRGRCSRRSRPSLT